MARRRGANPDPVVQVLGIARDRAAYVLEASPLLRYALEFFVAHALAAWSGSEAQYDRLQDSRIAEVAKRLDSMQQLGAYRMQGAESQETNSEIIKYTRTKDMPQRNRQEQGHTAHAAASDAEWEQKPSEWAMGLWLSWSMAIGAITCSGTTCLWRAKLAKGAILTAQGGHGMADQRDQIHPADAERDVRGNTGMRRRHQAVQRRSLRQSRAALRTKAQKALVCSDGEEKGGATTPPQLDAATAEGARMGLPEAGRPPAPAAALCDSSHRGEGDQHEGMQLAISVANAKPARYRADLDRTCSGADTHAGEICTTRPPITMPEGIRRG